jgi:hypothetical protein
MDGTIHTVDTLAILNLDLTDPVDASWALDGKVSLRVVELDIISSIHDSTSRVVPDILCLYSRKLTSIPRLPVSVTKSSAANSFNP